MTTDQYVSDQDLDSAIEERFFIKRNDFTKFYSNRFSALSSAEKAFRNLVIQLTDTEDFERPKIVSRIKDCDGCIKKFEIKYRNNAEKSGDYEIKNYITDLIGVRVICLYETDIPKIASIIKQHFKVIYETDKTKALMTEVDAFGYKGLHYDVTFAGSRLDLPEYGRFKEMRAEIQIRSIVQDAWSEVEHKLRYKRQAPISVQRRVKRLAALFELADQEFSALNEETEKLILQATQGGGNIFESAIEPQELADVLNAFSFLGIATKYRPGYNFGSKEVDGFVDEIKQMDQNFKTKELQETLNTHAENVIEYKKYQHKNRININPYTEMRLALYAQDKKRFSDILYPNQRRAFEIWMRDNKGVEF